mgnify:CR=1 FL=1
MKKLLTILFIGLGMATYAQEFELSAELRPRFEYRHGYKTLSTEDVDAATWSSVNPTLSPGDFDWVTSETSLVPVQAVALVWLALNRLKQRRRLSHAWQYTLRTQLCPAKPPR